MESDVSEILAKKRNLRKISGIITLFSALILFSGILLSIFFNPRPIGPRQPIPFSHRVHANHKQISCFFCHPGARMSTVADIPPLERCMLCHSRIITSYAPIKDLVSHYKENTPVLWEKVYSLPDFVYFPHQMHIVNKIDCSQCHGDVKRMDRIVITQKINMGFCISCHRKNNAPIDCFTCHR